MPLLEVSNLRKTFDGYVAVDGVSLHVDSGEIFGLVGPNGAGKTTTIRMLSGLLHPDSGTIKIDGHPFDIRNFKDRLLLGLVPQELAVYPDLTALENLKFFSRLYGVRGTEMTRRVGDILEATGLTEHANGLVKTFSGGMKRRLNFGVALLHKPRLLILDEPTVGVDPQSRTHLLECVTKLGDQVAVIYTSHYMEEVKAICKRIAIMDHGRILACGSQSELLGQGQTLYLRVTPSSAQLKEALKQIAEVRVTAGSNSILPHYGSAVSPANEINVVFTAGATAGSGSLDKQLCGVLDVIHQKGGEVLSIVSEENNLERLFLKLTGRQLRD